MNRNYLRRGSYENEYCSTQGDPKLTSPEMNSSASPLARLGRRQALLVSLLMSSFNYESTGIDTAALPVHALQCFRTLMSLDGTCGILCDIISCNINSRVKKSFGENVTRRIS
jgi:hypothetical protein